MQNPQKCHICPSNAYIDIKKHVQAVHSCRAATTAQKRDVWRDYGLFQCACNKWTRSRKGFKQHLSRSANDGKNHSCLTEYNRAEDAFGALRPQPPIIRSGRVDEIAQSPGNPVNSLRPSIADADHSRLRDIVTNHAADHSRPRDIVTTPHPTSGCNLDAATFPLPNTATAIRRGPVTPDTNHRRRSNIYNGPSIVAATAPRQGPRVATPSLTDADHSRPRDIVTTARLTSGHNRVENYANPMDTAMDSLYGRTDAAHSRSRDIATTTNSNSGCNPAADPLDVPTTVTALRHGPVTSDANHSHQRELYNGPIPNAHRVVAAAAPLPGPSAADRVLAARPDMVHSMDDALHLDDDHSHPRQQAPILGVPPAIDNAHRALIEAPDQTWLGKVLHDPTQAFQSLANLPTTRLPLKPSIRKEWQKACERMARRYQEEPTETNLILILGLPKVGLAPGHTRLTIARCRRRLRQYPQILPPPVGARGSASTRPLADQVHHHLRRGEIRAAARAVRGTNPLAPATEDTLAQLLELHPENLDDPFGDYDGPPGEPLSNTCLTKAIHQLAHDVGVGISGWTTPLLKAAYEIDSFATWLTLLGRQIAAGTAPGAQYLCTAKLIPLTKPGSTKVRPIAVGELFYRVITKAILLQHCGASQLHDHQLGVGSKLGVEPIIRLGETEIMETAEVPEKYLIDIDFSNAFNTINRSCIAAAVRRHAPTVWRAVKWAYRRPTPLVINLGGATTVIESQQGARQGEPWGPFLFSLGIRDVFETVHNNVVGPTDITMAYLDDIKIVAANRDTYTAVMEYLDSPRVRQHTNLTLNQSKSSCTPADAIRTTGTEMLGSYLGPPEARRLFLREKIDKVLTYLPRLKALRSQDGLLLLRHCLSRDVTHLLRSLDCSDIADEWQRLDLAIEATLDHFRAAGTDTTESPATRPITRSLYHLPIRMGGVGIVHHGLILPAARTGYKDATSRFLEQRGLPFVPPPPPMDATEDATDDIPQTQKMLTKLIHRREYRALTSQLNPYQKAIFSDQVNNINGTWMTCGPRTKWTTLSDREVAVGLRQRTLTPVHTTSAHCLSCGAFMNLNHQESCAAVSNRRQYRHNALRDLLADQVKSLDREDPLLVELEPLVADPDSTDRTDLRIVGNIPPNGIGQDYDIGIIAITASRFTATPERVLTQARGDTKPNAISHFWVAKRVTTKTRKYEGRTRYPFQALIMTTGGTMNKKFQELIRHLQEQTSRPLRAEIAIIMLRYTTRITSPRN